LRRQHEGVVKVVVWDSDFDGPRTYNGVTGHYRSDPVTFGHEDFAAASEDTTVTDQDGV
jgi:hypothetical protein